MIFSDSERECYRKELEAASKAGDLNRVMRLIDQIRLLGEIRENAIKSTGIQEYIKHQSMVEKEKNREDKPLTCNGLLDYIKNMKPSEDLPTINLGKIGTPFEDKMWEDVLGDWGDISDDDIALTDRAEMPFRGVLQQGFKDSGWTW